MHLCNELAKAARLQMMRVKTSKFNFSCYCIDKHGEVLRFHKGVVNRTKFIVGGVG